MVHRQCKEVLVAVQEEVTVVGCDGATERDVLDKQRGSVYAEECVQVLIKATQACGSTVRP